VFVPTIPHGVLQVCDTLQAAPDGARVHAEQLSGTHERGAHDALARQEAPRVVHGEAEAVAILVDDEQRDIRWQAGQRHPLDGATDGLLQLGEREAGAVVRKGTPRHGLTWADQYGVDGPQQFGAAPGSNFIASLRRQMRRTERARRARERSQRADDPSTLARSSSSCLHLRHLAEVSRRLRSAGRVAGRDRGGCPPRRSYRPMTLWVTGGA